MNQSLNNWEKIVQTFQHIWGYEDFRYPQKEIIQCLLESQDALIVMPTGGGKSLCFQLPALLNEGLILVISPLVALMENQVYDLKNRQLPAELLHNEIPRDQKKITLQKIKNNQLRLLYLSPETLLINSVWQVLVSPDVKINGLILDEAHCLVQWGETFRPAYRRLGAVRTALIEQKAPHTKIAIAAFTATANPQSQGIIERVLQLENPQIFCLSPYRSNLNLNVKIAWTPRCRRDLILQFIKPRKRQSGLIYVRSRRDSEILTQWLQSVNYKVGAYHAGLSPQKRREIENKWLEESLQFVVCTSAFGLGINKANVRWIIHFQSPYLLSEYLQEIGRGGRDGNPAHALTLMSEPTGWLDPSDQQRDKYLKQQLQKQYQQVKQLIKQIPKQGEINAITQQFTQGKIILSLLHSAGQLEWIDPFNYRLKTNISTINLSQLQSSQNEPLKQMRQYLYTKKCRWQFLLEAFGFKEEAKEFKCGHCDNCHRQS
ncbi:RecQ family ATP-dependent DNA helicase [Aphanothece sacrum]|uniref:ATP-dependent DNA helicase RecQ n=1 Tax=Aphanothece sacrum FPU1 TaxID=1920663 RepID=A0A401IGA2_APHSA|nr:RecQ family ATP-dependent DNA helicase [Aphanothece sacrum]GBF80239.1 ATP-dependent DNA helicase RecQ [Aphanothece sacrum FPU1]GBF83644.1 ATP-dependent DNA helicase RecQ [Aphanothece sacrum FPU3]